MKELFTIGEMAKLFGVNIRTLRYYDEIGILCPETTDPDSGYRYYSTRQFERMNSIKYLRALDMPLKSIALFLKEGRQEPPVSDGRAEAGDPEKDKRSPQD